MWEAVKRSLAFGLGAAMLTGEKLREFVDDAVARGEMNRDEAKKFFDDVMKRGEEEKQNMQTWIRDQVNKRLREAGCADETRVTALEKRVQVLEEKLAISSKTPTPPPTAEQETAS